MIYPKLSRSNPIVNADGTMSDVFWLWAQQAGLSIPITGAGSPEGVIAALQFSLYIDTVANAEYRKMLPSVAGDTKQGWVLM